MAISTFSSPKNLPLLLVLATLHGKPIKITNIHSTSLNPGLQPHEVSLLRLLESLTNGTTIEISYTGTSLIYKPGLIIGGSFTHTCPDSRSIPYYLIPILLLAPFSKNKFSIIFKGLTSKKGEPGLDFVRWSYLPLLDKFGIKDVELHILKRGTPPAGGGEVHLIVNSRIPQPITVHVLDVPKISTIRGVAWCARVSPSVVNRLVDSARSVLRHTGCDVQITTDVWRGENSGKSPGFGLTLFTESRKTPLRYVVDDIGEAGDTPEDIGQKVALSLLECINSSGSVSREQLDLVLPLMTIGKEDIGRFIVHRSQIDASLLTLLREIKQIFGTEFFFQQDDEYPECLIATCKGIGFTNASKKIA